MKQRSFSNRGLLGWPPDPVRLAGQRANTAPADANPDPTTAPTTDPVALMPPTARLLRSAPTPIPPPAPARPAPIPAMMPICPARCVAAGRIRSSVRGEAHRAEGGPLRPYQARL